jgi:hypothetical protein
MNRLFKFLPLFGALAIAACDSSSSTGPDKPTNSDNPFKGKWQYIKFVAYENDGMDTVDYSDDYKKDFILYYDTTGRYIISTRPTSPLDSIHYKYNDDSLFVTSFVDNFLNFKGRPYVFKGKDKDTLDFSDPMHIEVLIRTN